MYFCYIDESGMPSIPGEVTALNSPSLPGAALSLKAFKIWISKAESQSTVSLEEAKSKWAGRRKQLQKRFR